MHDEILFRKLVFCVAEDVVEEDSLERVRSCPKAGKCQKGTKVAAEMLQGEQRKTQDRSTRSATRVGTLVLITSSKYAKLFTRVGKPQSLEPEGNVKRKHVIKTCTGNKVNT